MFNVSRPLTPHARKPPGHDQRCPAIALHPACDDDDWQPFDPDPLDSIFDLPELDDEPEPEYGDFWTDPDESHDD